MSVVVLSGNPRVGSRTSAVALELARALVAAGVPGGAGDPAGDGEIVAVELADLAGEVLTGGAATTAAREVVAGASLLVVATPVYKGAYTGLLKAFLDTYAEGELGGVPTVALVIAGKDGHLHAGETHLRPVLLEVGAALPAPALALPQRLVGEHAGVLEEWVGRYGALLTASSRAVTSPVAVPA
ncbi:FMN reductase [Serinibacter arcticus]|uniref:FMN reductase n=1 Tax=Serinibacter arcticus TaxID=1655435 RepID=A0A2U1ZVC9_9MICO|nr:NAD(P)H-dependent oxidoreductase [Serinibacter arcticus]PWD50924.1 FMN reductase [Serinibacter arcticus]